MRCSSLAFHHYVAYNSENQSTIILFHLLQDIQGMTRKHSYLQRTCHLNARISYIYIKIFGMVEEITYYQYFGASYLF